MVTLDELTFLPEKRTITVARGTTLLQAMRTAGVIVEAPCDGRGTCGKCQVRATGKLTAPTETEIASLGNLLVDGIRLACQAKVAGAAQVEQMSQQVSSFVTVEEGQGTRQWPLEPPVNKIVFEKIDDEQEQRDLAQGLLPLFPENYPELLQKIAARPDGDSGKLAAVVKNGKLLDWQYQTGRTCYGIALDIGTTSVVAELFDLASGETLGVAACLNPQTEFGGDVLTRISFAAKQVDGTLLLQKKIIEGINLLIKRLIAAKQLDSQDIYEMVVAGNTTMQHLLLGVFPGSLAYAPYRPVFTQQVEVPAARLNLMMAKQGVVTVLPSAAAFVGADIMAGLLAVGLPHSSKTTLFIDIGTNGEIVLCRKGLLVGTSSAAGPALEGMNIACGCRAETGAVEAAVIQQDGALQIKVIGNGLPTGICGSGLIDLIAELVRCGVIAANGRFAKPEKVPVHAARLIDMAGQQTFAISEGGQVFLSQKDIRQVQLAKGAIATAINLLLKEIDISFAEIEEVLVAGAFGFHLKPSSLVGIGLLPYSCQNKIRFVGNTAKEGAKAVLLNRHASVEIQQIGRSIKTVELSLHPEFQDCFVQTLAFPTLR